MIMKKLQVQQSMYTCFDAKVSLIKSSATWLPLEELSFWLYNPPSRDVSGCFEKCCIFKLNLEANQNSNKNLQQKN